METTLAADLEAASTDNQATFDGLLDRFPRWLLAELEPTPSDLRCGRCDRPLIIAGIRRGELQTWSDEDHDA